MPRRYLGEISRVDAPVMIVGLLAELEYRAGVVWPAERRVIEMPRAVNDGPRPRMTQSPAARAPVVSIRLESERTSRVGKVVVGGVAIGVAGCVLAISLFRGGVVATRAFYTPSMQENLPFSSHDDRSTVLRIWGQPAAERWSPAAGSQFELLAYPHRGLYVILMGHDSGDMRYIGAMDWNWRPAHAVDVAGYGSGYGLLRRLARF